MSPIPSTQLLTQLQWRYATKQFDSTAKICPEDWAALEESLILTPSSFGLQPWKFIVVTDPAVREQLKAVSWGQGQVTDCSHHVVFAIRTDVDQDFIQANMKLTAEVRGVPLDSLAGLQKVILGFLPNVNVQEWSTRQAYIALGNFMTSAALIGVDTCPMEGIDPAQYDRILGLEAKKLKTVVACSAGYRASGDKYANLKKVRFPKSEIVSAV
ncbi:MAG: NAD(P)H-dependent oxidoreductase [Blastochloris sp.]|nr:NAD(P)H-dependent oxidoreductase [Blastochloris sp.]